MPVPSVTSILIGPSRRSGLSYNSEYIGSPQVLLLTVFVMVVLVSGSSVSLPVYAVSFIGLVKLKTRSL